MNRRLLNLMCLALPASVLVGKPAQAGRNPPSKPQPSGEPVPVDPSASAPTPTARQPRPTLKAAPHRKSPPKCKPKVGAAADCVDDIKKKD
jgi:hypothetical protein